MRRLLTLLGVLATISIASYVAFAAISIPTTSPYAQTFDGIGTTATATLPVDFRVDKQTTVRTLGTYAAAGTTTALLGGANLSTSASNGIYNFGAGTTTTGPDRAIGFVTSGSAGALASGNVYAQLVNSTGTGLSGLKISYNVEKYRNGANGFGYRFQMFYSNDGATWTNAGAAFLTSFGADLNNNGFTTAPGATVAVTNQTLNVPIADGATFYLAWSFSTTTGTTTTNSQALAVDDISIQGVALGPTNPTGTGSASPGTVQAGTSTLLTVDVTAGQNPTSTGLGVTADLSSIGGSSTQAFAGSGNTFTFTATVAAGTSAGAKSLPATITDAEGRAGSTSIALTVQSPTDAAPAITGVAPQDNASGVPIGANVAVTFSEPVTTTNAFSLACGGAAQAFAVSSAANTFTLDPAGDLPYATSCTVFVTAANVKDTDTNDPPDTMAGDVSWTFMTENPPPQSAALVVMSQIYGGGGNSGATYQNDFVELYNRSASTVNITGWSLQYSSATGSSWGNGTGITNLYGTIDPGQYYLVALASGGATGAVLPTANITGPTNIAAAAGKLALVSNLSPLTGTCPVTPAIVDFVGYGSTANCKEGAAVAPAPSNTTSLFRKQNGAWDTDDNGRDFVTGSPAPRQTAPIVTIEVGPTVTSTDPSSGASTAPHDATIEVDFSEPVTVDAGWFSIACVLSGVHDSVTEAVNGKSRYITPNVGFVSNEQCTVTVHKDSVHDTDDDDILPGTDTLPADFVWSFTVSGDEHPPYTADVHLAMGNPSGAMTIDDLAHENDYLMSKPEFALSYSRALGRPNWVSWHLTPEWYGTLTRVDTFRPDPAVPPEWYRVQSFDFQLSGFDRGHMVPNADRDGEIPINQATYLMSNMIAQAPDNNQGPWANMENALRSIADAGNELYVVSGPAGTGGTGSNGFKTTLANGQVTVPASTWKVALVLTRANGDDVSRVTCATRTIAVIMPNTQGIRTSNPNDWQAYLTTVDAVESLTGYDLFSNVPQTIQNCIQAGVNGNNPQSQVITFPPIATHHLFDADFPADAVASSGLPVTLTVVSGPAAIVNGLIRVTGLGTVTIRATQPGNASVAKAVPVEQTFDVGKATQAITVDSLSNRTYGEGPVTVNATGGASGNPVTFAVSGPCDATGVNGETIVLTGAGTCSVTASQGGSDTYEAAADITQTFEIAPAPLTVTANDASREFGAPNPPLTGTLTGVVGSDGITASFSTTATPASPVGSYEIAPSLSDPNGRLGNYVVTATSGALSVVDTTPPTIGDVTASPNTIWPPNKQMIPVSITVAATDAADPAAVCSVTGVSSNEPQAGDSAVTGPLSVSLLADRNGNGSGRIMRIMVRCVDASGNTATGSTTVVVPHDQRK